MDETIKITTTYITLGQLLKTTGVIDTGGAVKPFLDEHRIFVNGETEDRRGKKLYGGDTVEISGIGRITILS